MTPAGVKYVRMYDSCRSQVCQYVYFLQESTMYLHDSCKSQVFQCMTPTRVKYVSMHDTCGSQVVQCMTPEGVKYVFKICMTSAEVMYLHA